MQHIMRWETAGPAVAVPAAIARVVGTEDAPAQADAPLVIYGAG